MEQQVPSNWIGEVTWILLRGNDLSPRSRFKLCVNACETPGGNGGKGIEAE